MKKIYLLIFLLTIVLNIDAQKVYKVGAFNYYPGIFKDKDGTIKGFYVDALCEIEKNENIRFEYVFGTWAEGLERIKADEVDVLTSVAHSPERALFMDYTETPLLTVWGEVYVKPNSEIDGILDLSDINIAVMRGDINGLHLKELTRKLSVNCNFVEVDDYDQVFSLINNSTVDAGVVNNTFGAAKFEEYNLYSSGIIFNPFDIHFTVPKNKNSELLILLESYLKNWKTDNKSVYNIARQQWSHGEIGKIQVFPVWIKFLLMGIIFAILILFVFIILLRYRVKRATAKILENENISRNKSELLSEFVKNSPIYTYIKRIEPNNSKVLYASDNFIEMVGIPATEMIGKNMYELFPPEFAEKITTDDILVVENGKIIVLDEDLNNKNYTTIKFPVKFENEQYLAGYTIDITERKQNELELIAAKKIAEENQETFKKLFEDSADAILLIDKTGVFVECNQATLNLLKMNREQFLLKPPVDISPKYQPDGQSSEIKAIEMIETAYKNGLHRFDWTCINSEGVEFIVEVSLMPIKIKGELMLYTAWRDITERISQENELIKTKEKAEESDRLKTAFLQNISHEIRTPMNAIIGFSSLLPEYFTNKEKLSDFSNIINQRCKDLLDIITDILDISKIESGQATVNIEECNLIELLSEIQQFSIDYQKRTEKKHIQLMFETCNNNEITIIKTDSIKLKQILINLITNAFKFTEMGTIVCGCKLVKNKLEFYVSDTGIGISDDKKEFVFERFSQIKHETINNIGGTGLGLPIVKGLVGLLGGEVWVESEQNKGTKFQFTIDYFAVNDIKKQGVEKSNSFDNLLIGNTILIVEDDGYNALYLQEILSNNFKNIIVVGLGKDAISYVENHIVDIILMDVRLPDMLGYEATKEILKNKPYIKIIIQTAYASSEERQKALSYGCVDYISKPTKQELLLKMINKHIN